MSTSSAAPTLPRIPLVPQSVLKVHGVDCIIDTRFRAAARLLQRLWLKDNNIATGLHVRSDAEGQILLPLESLLSREALALVATSSHQPFIPSFDMCRIKDRRQQSSVSLGGT